MKSIEIESGANLLQSLLQAGVPVASSCFGDGVCAKCRLQVVSGAEHLSKPNELELFLKEKNRIPAVERIACQTTVHGDITVDANYW